MSVYASILAGGSGTRFSSTLLKSKNADTGRIEILPKQFYKIGEESILELSCDVFQNSPEIDKFVVVTNEKFIDITKTLLEGKYSKLIAVVAGGRTRVESSFKGILKIAPYNPSKVLIHDAVRPWVTNDLISRVVRKLDFADAVQPIVPVSQTIVKKNYLGFWETQNREDYATVQTPQGFKFLSIYDAFERLDSKLLTSKHSGLTDDISVWQRANNDKLAAWVDGDINNKKITVAKDL